MHLGEQRFHERLVCRFVVVQFDVLFAHPSLLRHKSLNIIPCDRNKSF
jgi:hypothetical protein